VRPAERPTIGIHVTLTDQSVPLDEIGTALEERGIEGIYLSEHTHIPVNYDRRTYPEEGGMPERYKRVFDPYIASSFLAARYQMEVGTCVSVVANHDALALAKAVATLDYLSDGRFFLGVGFGWCAEEFASHKEFPPQQRPEVVRETVELMKAVWRDDVASFKGRYLNLVPSWSWPKPLSHPHPPILLGAPPTTTNFTRLAEWADGWITMQTFPLDDDFGPTMSRLRRHWEIAGRDPEALQILALVSSLELERIVAALDICRDEGVQRLAVHIGETTGRDLYHLLDGLGHLCAS
jgi:probable F420-dependent oxidoreductase